MISQVIHIALTAAACLAGTGCGADKRFSDYINKRVASPVPEAIQLYGVEPGTDLDLEKYTTMYTDARPKDLGPITTKLLAFRWASQATVNQVCEVDDPLNTDVIGCCSADAYSGLIVLSAQWRDSDKDARYHNQRVRNLALHELGHCLDHFDHLPDGQAGIMQPSIAADGFANIWSKALNYLFKQLSL